MYNKAEWISTPLLKVFQNKLLFYFIANVFFALGEGDVTNAGNGWVDA